MKSTSDKDIFKIKERTIEIKLSDEECKALEECFKALKEIKPVVIDFEEKELKWEMKCFYQLFFQWQF